MLEVTTQVNNNNNDNECVNRMAGQGVTNFSIDAILQPEFGKRTIDDSRKVLSANVAILPNIVNYLSMTRTIPYSVSSERTERYSIKKCKLEPGEIISSQYRQSCVVRPKPSRAKTVSPGAISRRPSSSPEINRPVSSPASSTGGEKKEAWPAWVYCTRYSDRPSSGPRSRKNKRKSKQVEEKRPRTAFTSEQLQVLKTEFSTCQYLTESRRQSLSNELQLNESQIKIWFQNKRAKLKKSTSEKGELAKHLMANGLYNHSNNNTRDAIDTM